MGVINMSKNIKQVHPNYLLCYKVGAFYHCYDKDVYLLSDLFEYRIKRVDESTLASGFPKNALAKVMAKLEREKINYIMLDTKNNYDIEYKEDYGNLNKYNEKFQKARESVNFKIRVEKISEVLLKEHNIEKIRKIEAIINEKAKT